MAEKKFLDLLGLQKYDEKIKAHIASADAKILSDANNYAESLADNYDAAGTAATKVQELADGQVKTNAEHIGTMDNLETTAKSDLVNAINEVRNAVSAGGTAAAITITEQTTGLGEGVLKAYVLKQGENTVGTINIPKDMVVQSGEVVVDPEGQAAGTYIKLTLANATNDVIYVNVGTLVDIYKAKASAAQIQIAIDSATREISATVVAGSITATELAADSVVTVKIADGNVTKAKLSTDVQASLDKADAAAGLAQAAEDNAKSHADDLNTAMNTRVEALEAIDHEHANAAVLNGITADKVAAWDAASGDAANALAGVKSELEGKITDGDKANKDLIDALDGRVGTAETDIDNLQASLATGGATANAIAEAKQAGIDAGNAVTTLENGKVADLRTDVDALKADTHTHANATQLATYDKTQTELLDAAKTDASNKDAVVLAEAQNYTDAAFGKFVEISAAEINAMFGDTAVVNAEGNAF